MDLDVPNKVVNEDVVIEAFSSELITLHPAMATMLRTSDGLKRVVANRNVDVDFSSTLFS